MCPLLKKEKCNMPKILKLDATCIIFIIGINTIGTYQILKFLFSIKVKFFVKNQYDLFV